MRGHNRAGILGAVAALLGLAPTARAHLVTSGLGPIYDGIGHFLLSPEDIVAALALALLAGLRGPAAGRLAMALVPAAWLASGLLGLLVAVPPPLTPGELTAAVALTLLLPGLLAAADCRLPAGGLAVLALVSAGLHGFFNGLAQREAGPSAGALALVGIAAATFALVTLGAALVVSLRAPGPRIALRVLGSWIAALGLLLLGWAFRAA